MSLGAGGAFTTDVPITEGANALTVVATNAAGLSVTATRHVVRDTQSICGFKRPHREVSHGAGPTALCRRSASDLLFAVEIKTEPRTFWART